MQHYTWLVAIFISTLVNMAFAQSTLPPTSRTVYKCNEKGKTVYSDAPCLGATKVDVEPTRGFNKDTGREIIGTDVRREQHRELMADAFKPLTGLTAEQCAKDYATGLIWEGKSLDPADMRFVGLTFTNFDSTTALQVEFEIAGRPSVYAAPTSGQVNAESNSIGYKNAVNASALCGFTDWRLPSRNELVALGLLSSKLSDFPEVSSRAYWTNESGFDRDSTGSVLRPPATAGNKEYRGNSFGIRLVRSSR